MFSLASLFVLIFFSIAITSLGEKRAGLCVSRASVCLSCTHYFLSFFSWCQGLAAACYFGTPWTFPLLTYFLYQLIVILQNLDYHYTFSEFRNCICLIVLISCKDFQDHNIISRLK